MVCNTRTKSEDGTQGFKYKKAFETLDLAIAEAKKLNALDDHTMKLVGYKCSYCCKYHIGRNGKLIKSKEKIKYKKETNSYPKILGKIILDTSLPIKVVGWVDLSKIKYYI